MSPVFRYVEIGPVGDNWYYVKTDDKVDGFMKMKENSSPLTLDKEELRKKVGRSGCQGRGTNTPGALHRPAP